MLRWIGRIFGFVVLLALLAVGFVALMPADQVARIAVEQLRAATGRDVVVSGDVSISLWPVLGARVGALEVGNADWSRQGPMLTAREAAIGLDAAALLRGDFRITHIEATSPTIRLESRRDGRASWQFTDAAGTAQIETGTDPATDPARAPGLVSIERLDIRDATLVYDAEGADLVEYSGVDLAIDWPDQAGPAQIDAVIRSGGAPVMLAARVEDFAAFATGEPRAVDLRLETADGSAQLVGQAAITGAVTGDLSLKTGATDAFLLALGLSGSDLPAGLGRSLALAARLTLTPGRQLALRDLDMDLGAGNRLRGWADIALNGVPRVAADLTAGALDLTALAGNDAPASAAAAGGGAAAASGWPQTPIDASGLAAFDGTIALAADSVDLGVVELGPSRATLVNDRSRMVVTLQEVSAFGGNVAGDVVMNNRDGLSIGGRLTGRAVELKRLLSDLAGLTRLTGMAEMELEFLGVGQSVDAIMRSLRGKGAVTVGRGTIQGLDLDRLMRAGDAGPGTTVFDSLTASYTIGDGDLRNDDLQMLLPGVEARGSGRVGLGARDLDYLFAPRALRVNDGRGLVIPVRIRGPWSDPRVELDHEAALELNFDEERRQVERDMRDKVESGVAKELGVTPEEGQSIEDAIEKKLEKEIGRGLMRLFD